MGTWQGGKEKSPAAVCRKVASARDGDTIEIWGDGLQTRSYLYIDECLEAVERFMNTEFSGPVNIGSEEMVSINELVEITANYAGKKVNTDNIFGERFESKYGKKCPLGVRGRKSHNDLFKEKMGWVVSEPLAIGIGRTYDWIEQQIKNTNHESSN